MPRLIILIAVLMMPLVGTYVIEANQEYWSITADGVDPVMVEYNVAGSYYACVHNEVWYPTTWEFETYYKHYWAEDETPEVGQWLCLHLDNGHGYEEVKVKLIELLYHSFIPITMRW